MKGLKTSISSLCLSSLILSVSAQADSFIGPITVNGNALVDNTNSRFMVRGMAVGAWNSLDPLADANNPDFESKILPTLKALNINAIRVYGVNQSGPKHDLTMNLLRDNNIFVQIDLATNGWSINRASPQYDPNLVARFQTIVKTFSKFDNVLSFLVGNEVVDPFGFATDPTYHCVASADPAKCANGLSMRNSQILKALIRDLRVLQAQSNLRKIPIGTAMRDTPSNASHPGVIGTEVIAQYYACVTTPANLPVGANFPLQAGFVGINSYRYVPGGEPDVNLNVVSEYNIAKYDVPVWFTESDGSIPTAHRDFKDITYLFNNAAEYDYISGQNVYQLFNGVEGGGNALYNWSTASGLTPVHPDTVTNLTNVYNGLPSVPMPASPSGSVPCPDNFNPVVPGTNLASVTIDNTPNAQAVNIVQFGNVITNIPAGQKVTLPNVTVGGYAPIYVLTTNWAAVCIVDNPESGATYKDDVSWGPEVACNKQ